MPSRLVANAHFMWAFRFVSRFVTRSVSSQNLLDFKSTIGHEADLVRSGLELHNLVHETAIGQSGAEITGPMDRVLRIACKAFAARLLFNCHPRKCHLLIYGAPCQRLIATSVFDTCFGLLLCAHSRRWQLVATTLESGHPFDAWQAAALVA